MTFSLYDILSKVIPGGLILFVLIAVCPPLKTHLGEATSLVAAYILGYFVETIASLIERPLIFKLFGKNPAVKLLEGGRFLHIDLDRIEQLNEIIEKDFEEKKDDKLSLFSTFYDIVNKKEYKRVNHFLEHYILSRNILVSFLIGGITYLSFHFDLKMLALFIVVLILLFLRTKQRNYYFAKEVISSYLHEALTKEKNKIKTD